MKQGVKEYAKAHPRKIPTKKVKTVRVKDNRLSSDGAKVQLYIYRIGDVSEMVGLGIQSLRMWELKGWIPKPAFKGNHRFYTKDQINLIYALKKYLDQLPNSKKPQAAKEKYALLKARWLNVSLDNIL